MTKEQTARILYTAAIQADARMSETIKSRTGRDRWTMTKDDERIPEVADAVRAFMVANDAWMTFLRTSREAR